jgi:hypothetical protein
MSDEKPEGVLERKAHRFALGGRAVAVLSLLLLVPYLRRRRERHHGRWHGRFPVPGH